MVIGISAAHHWEGREGHRPRFIIVHGTAGFTSAQDVGHFFANPHTEASTHYVIGQEGTVVQCVQEEDAAWANGAITGPQGSFINQTGFGNGFHDAYWDSGINPNLLSIAIEHVKPQTDNSDQLTEAQQQASFQLIQQICERWDIPRRWADHEGGITGHFSMDPRERARCPGPYPWQALFDFLGGTDMLHIHQVAGFFEEVAQDRWHCKQTGFDIAFGILNFYRTDGRVGLNGLSRYGLPVSGEINLGNGNAVVQHFERGSINFDPQHLFDKVLGYEQTDCYPAHVKHN